MDRKTRIENAARAYAEGDFARAAALYEEVLEVEEAPEERKQLLLKLASARDETGEYEAALKALKEALEIDRAYPAAWNNVGVICQRLGRLDEAAQAFEQAYRLDPENAAILISLGSVALKRGDPGNALTYLALAEELQPAHPIVHANLALTYAVFGRVEEAEDALRLAALYGFEGVDAIQQRIDQLKSIRDRIMAGEEQKSAKDEETIAEEPSQSDSEIVLLHALERDMAQLAEQYYRLNRGEAVAGAPADIDQRLDSLREHITALRRRLGLDEEAEGDSYMGWNYMRERMP
jgi:tetratricopeptide (TPR) repeat protein